MPLTSAIRVPFEGDSKDLERKIDALNSDFDKFSEKNRKMSEENAAAADKATMSWTDFRSMYSTVLDVARTGQQVWAQTGQAFADYAGQVTLLARTAGTTTEEASRLIQVADDMGVSFEELSVMTRKMTQEGISPSIEAMGKLSDQYLAMQDPAERAKFLLDNFGRAGLEMGRLMEQGSAGLEMMNSKIEDNLVLTSAQTASAEQYRVEVDKLSDSWNGFKITLGSEALPIAVSMLERGNAAIEQAGGLLGYLKEQWVLLLGPIGAAIELYRLFNATIGGTSAKAPAAPAKATAKAPAKAAYVVKTGGKSPDERDSGGPGIAGQPYMIGTGAQPEMYVPETNGTFIPNADKKGALGTTYNIVVNNPKKETAENSILSALKNLSALRGMVTS